MKPRIAFWEQLKLNCVSSDAALPAPINELRSIYPVTRFRILPLSFFQFVWLHNLLMRSEIVLMTLTVFSYNTASALQHGGKYCFVSSKTLWPSLLLDSECRFLCDSIMKNFHALDWSFVEPFHFVTFVSWVLTRQSHFDSLAVSYNVIELGISAGEHTVRINLLFHFQRDLSVSNKSQLQSQLFLPSLYRWSPLMFVLIPLFRCHSISYRISIMQLCMPLRMPGSGIHI